MAGFLGNIKAYDIVRIDIYSSGLDTRKSENEYTNTRKKCMHSSYNNKWNHSMISETNRVNIYNKIMKISMLFIRRSGHYQNVLFRMLYFTLEIKKTLMGDQRKTVDLCKS